MSLTRIPEESLKRAVLCLGLALLPLPCAAQGLLTGVVRDQDGAVVAGAEVTARDGRGASLESVAAGPDGTFAIDVPAATLQVRCDYCRPLSVVAGSSPLILFVQRYRALTSAAPNARDLAALPYARPKNQAALIPFTTISPQNVSFGVDRGRALIATGGLAAYSIADGTTALSSFPDRYLEQLAAVAPAQGYRYGSYGDGGSIDFEPFADERLGARLDSGREEDLALRYAAGPLSAAVGASEGGGVRRARADLGGTAPLLGGILRTSAALAEDGDQTYGALAGSYATFSRRYATFADVNAMQLDQEPVARPTPESAGSSIFAGIRVRNLGPAGLEFGGRVRSSSGYYNVPRNGPQAAGTQDEAALYSDLSFSTGGGHVAAAAGIDGVRRSNPYAYGASTTLAPLGSLEYAQSLGAYVTLSASGIASVRVPTLVESLAYVGLPPVDRDQLMQTALTFTDRSRFSAELTAYRQRIAGATNTADAGLGLSLVWQIAPALALRTWSLQPSQNRSYFYYYAQTAPQRTQAVWLTYDAGTRVDAIYYTGHFDGDLNLPLDASTALRIGRDSSTGSPVYSFGLRYSR